MEIRKLLCLVILLTVVIAAPPVARADDGVLGARGTGVVLLQSDYVEMVAEKVDIYLYQGWAYVEAVFNLRNTGPAVQLLVGFPQEGQPYAESDNRNRARLKIRDFTTAVDGISLPVTYRADLSPPSPTERPIAGWYTFTLPFAAGQSRLVRNTYLLQPTVYSNGVTEFGYLLRTGATWKGSIGTADVLVHPMGGVLLTDLGLFRGVETTGKPDPSRDHVLEDQAVAWHLRDLEPGPEDDLLVRINQPIDMPVTAVFPDEARPGEKVQFQVFTYYHPVPWSLGSEISLYAGKERRRLTQATLLSSQDGIYGEFALPAGLTPIHGRAVEVWAEQEPSGIRARSALIYVNESPTQLPSTGGLPAGTTSAALSFLALSLVAAGSAISSSLRQRGTG